MNCTEDIHSKLLKWQKKIKIWQFKSETLYLHFWQCSNQSTISLLKSDETQIYLLKSEFKIANIYSAAQWGCVGSSSCLTAFLYFSNVAKSSESFIRELMAILYSDTSDSSTICSSLGSSGRDCIYAGILSAGCEHLLDFYIQHSVHHYHHHHQLQLPYPVKDG